MTKLRKKSKIAALAACFACIGAAAISVPLSAKADEAAPIESTSLWQAVKFAEIDYADSMPSYLYDRPAGAEEDLLAHSGVRLTGLGSGATIEYKNVLDLSDNTKDDVLIQIAVTPEVQGSPDFRCFKLRFTDADDESNYLEIDVHNSIWWYATTFYQAGTAEIESKGLKWGYYNETDSKPQGGQAGTQTDTGVFTGYAAQYKGGPRAVTLRYDANLKAVYADYPNGDNTKINRALVLDLDDPRQVGLGNEWKGFKRDRVKMSITMSDFGAAKASMIVTNLDGMDMSKSEIVDYRRPVLYTDADETPEILTAVVGKPYPMFGAVADDAIDGNIENIVKTVTDPNGKTVTVTDGTFVPELAGEHTLRYKVTDKSGHETENAYTLNCVMVAPEMRVKLDVEVAETGFVGKSIAVPTASVDGGVGLPVVSVKVTDVMGNDVKLENDCFTPTYAGEFFVEYSATDYLGNTATKVETVSVARSDAPIGEFPVLPTTVVAGKSIKFPECEMLDYASTPGNAAKAQSKIYVSYTEGEKGSEVANVYKPVLEGEVTSRTMYVTYEAWCLNRENGKLSKTYPVKVIKMVQLYDCFETLSGNFAYTPAPLYIDFTTEDDNAAMRYITPVAINNFELLFDVPAAANNFGSLLVTLTDSRNARQSLTLEFEGIAGKSKSNIYVNGENYEMSGSFDGTSTNPFNLLFKGETLVDYTGAVITKLKTFADGSKYTGFDSGRVYVEFEFKNVTGQSTLRLQRLADQSINADYRRGELQPFVDRSEPVIVTTGDIASEVELYSRVDLAPAFAYDAIDPYTECYVTVLDSEFNMIIDRKRAEDGGLYFYANSYGSYYINYEAVDSSGALANRPFTVTVFDKTPPTLTIVGALASKVKVGDAVAVPDAVALDTNSEAKLIIMVISPTGKMTDITAAKSFVPERAGKYTVRYYAYDAEFNGTTQNFTVIAEEK